MEAFEFYNNKWGVLSKWLYEEADVIKYSSYSQFLKRKHLILLRKGGNGRTALVEFDSIRSDIKKSIIDIAGDPYKIGKKYSFTEYLEKDINAEKYFNEYSLENGESLPNTKIKEYTNNASILNTISKIINDTLIRRKALGGNQKKMWENMAEIIKNLDKSKWPHSLPENYRRLRERLKVYQTHGYQILIHKNYCHTHSQKLTENSKLWLLAKWSNQVQRTVCISQLHQEYNLYARSEGLKTVEEKTIYNFIYDEEIMPLWYGHKFGELKYKEKYNYQQKTKLPTLRDSLWYSDGTKLNFFYLTEDGKMETISVYEVMDAYSEVLLGYHISKEENYQAQYSAYRMAIQFSGHKPYQIGFDNQGGHKKLEAGNFLNKIAHLTIKTQPYNGKSKTIENAFCRLQTQYLARYWFFTGQNIQAKKEISKANMEFILANKSNLPSLNEIKDIYKKIREEWNNSPHPNSGKSRLQTYLDSENEKAPKIELWDMVNLFWVEKNQPVKWSSFGFSFTEKKVSYDYFVYREDGMPDLDFHEKAIDQSFYVKYDPEDMSIIYLYQKDPQGQLRFVREAVLKTEIHRGKQEQEQIEAEWIKKVHNQNKNKRIQRRDEMDEILKSFNMDAESYGLVKPNLKGLENSKVGRKRKNTSIEDIGTWQKKESMLTTKDIRELY